MEEAQHLVEEGEHLPVDQEVLVALRHNLQLVQSWEARLSNIGHSQVGTPRVQDLGSLGAGG